MKFEKIGRMLTVAMTPEDEQQLNKVIDDLNRQERSSKDNSRR